MAFLKRISLFLLTNILVVATISIVINVLGIRPYLTYNGIDYQALLAFCLIWGFAGALISLFMSRFTAKWMLGVKLIDPRAPGQYAGIYNMVENLARAAGLPKTPEVGVYPSPEVNAFATGPSKRMALVAFSSGILNSMSRDELEAVTAHELSHVSNGDMVTMSLIQGVVNAFVMFLSRIISYVVTENMKESSRYMVRTILTFVLDILFSLLGLIVVMWFSRRREFRADAGAARLVGAEKMKAALVRLDRNAERTAVGQKQPALATLKISGSPGFWRLSSSHPSIAERIDALNHFR